MKLGRNEAIFVLLCALAACSDQTFAAGGDAGADGGSDASTTNDGGVDGSSGACAWDAPFGAPELVTDLTGSPVLGFVRLSNDELEIVATGSTADTSLHLFSAARASASASFPALALISNVNAFDAGADGGHDSDDVGTFSADRTTLLFNSNRVGGPGAYDIYEATRTQVPGDFGTPSLVANVNSAGDDVHPFLAFDGSELYFSSSRAGSLDIYRASVAGGGFGSPSPVNELNSAGIDQVPVLSSDGLTIYIASDRGAPSVGMAVYVAHRTSTTRFFTTPVLASELVTTETTLPAWLSADNCTLYLTRATAGMSNLAVWVARRSP
ncbi:MAG: TolB family protein [Polyangiaceae bacterium]